jgi:hypothetical protein
MTRDDIERMAKNEYGIYAFTAESLAQFAALVTAAEREACAKACEAEGERFKHHPSGRRDFSICAAAIRARGEQEQPR